MTHHQSQLEAFNRATHSDALRELQWPEEMQVEQMHPPLPSSAEIGIPLWQLAIMAAFFGFMGVVVFVEGLKP